MIAEFEQLKREGEAFRSVTFAFDAVVPQSTSENPNKLREERLQRDLLLIGAKIYAFKTCISHGMLNFDPEAVVREFIASREDSKVFNCF